MSQRRLAPVQPEGARLSPEAIADILAWTKKYPPSRQRSALIPALWIAQKDADGWLPEAVLREVGDMLGMAYIRVYEVATFYTMFNLAPVGRFHIQLCGTTPCWLRGADGLKDVLKRRVGPQNTVSADGQFSWIEVECLGACANAPMMQVSMDVDEDPYYEDLSPETLDGILDAFASGQMPERGPQNARHTSEPEGGAMALTTHDLSRARGEMKKLPNADKKVAINYYEWDPKERRATRGGWVDPKKQASRDPKKRPDNLGEDLSAGIVEDDPEKGRPARASAPFGEKPKVIYDDGPTDGAPDDLKKIKGIGPKFEAELNANGIFYYRQIGAWKAAEIREVERNALSRYPGRIMRDGWVKQARALAKTGAK